MKCLLIPIIVGLISAILGYLLGRLSKGKNNNHNKIAALEAELEACKKGKINLSSKSHKSAGIIPFNASNAKGVFGKTIKENSLTVVEGIGPKIEKLFHQHNVNSWKALSECTVEKCQKVLNSGGENYKLHNPKTWPKQAQMAYEGKWQQLFDWQEKLDGGV